MTRPGVALGVDIEPHKLRNVQAIAARAFGPEEQRLVDAGGAAAFYRLWTLREAMGKATGEGLSLAADGQDHVGVGPERRPWSVPGWRLYHEELPHGYSLACAVAIKDDEDMEIHHAALMADGR